MSDVVCENNSPMPDIESPDAPHETVMREADVMLPNRLKVLLAILLLIPVLWAVWTIASYTSGHPDASPNDLRLHETVLVCGVLLALLLIPWPRLGLVVKKVGWLEFERVVSVQKKESVDTIVALEARIDKLEQDIERVRLADNGVNVNPITQVQSGVSNAELRDILLKFLGQYDSWYFNAARISNWGRKQPGFERLSEYPTALITQELQRLLSQGLIRHKIGTSGATLYGATRPSA